MPITIENLPKPIVQYPCGAFITFKKSEEDDFTFCSCMYEAVENYIKLRVHHIEKELNNNKERYENFKRNNMRSEFILKPWDFPTALVEKLIDINVSEDKTIIKYLNFEDKLCHKCNRAVPAPTFCDPMYGGTFKQKYGWYILQKYYECGVNPFSYIYIKELCPEEILEIIDFKYLDLFNDLREKEIFISYSDDEIKYRLEELDELFKIKRAISSNDYEHLWAYEVSKIVNKRKRLINRIIENEVRLEFDQKKIGDAWTSETILYNIVKRLYHELDIKRHYRPKLLNYLELDVYIDDLKIGIEYQGLQHFKPVKHWGGKEGLIKTKERDKRKADLCKENDIYLIYFYHTENLSEELVRSRIENAYR